MKKILLLLTLLATLVSGAGKSTTTLHGIPLKDINGKDTSLNAYKGKVIMVVNVASECGLTPQYRGLEATYRKYKAQGFVVLGFPCNDFGGQEPGTNDEIKQFCSKRYDVSFPLMDKVHVKAGPKQHPLYAALTGKKGAFPGNVKWNFGKFLIGRDGKPLKRFEPGQKPQDNKVINAIEAALK